MAFGPNATSYATFKTPGYIHHREPKFKELMWNIDQEFRRAFFLTDAWDLMFLTGSGTLGLEALIHAMPDSGVSIRTKGEFSTRLEMVMRRAKKYYQGSKRSLGVLYETNDSRFCGDETPCTYWDLVSSFPYWPVPESCDAFVTVSSKQLGAAPIVSIVGVRKEAWNQTVKSCICGTYLCLGKWQSWMESCEVPHTPAIPALYDLYGRLRGFEPVSFIKKINDRRRKLEEIVPRIFWVGQGPVFTFTRDALPPAFVDRWTLYHKGEAPQVFLWGPFDDLFEIFLEELCTLYA